MDFLVHHLLRNSATLAPDKIAIAHNSDELSYRQAWDEVQRLATLLRRRGATDHDRIGIFLPPCIRQWLAILSCSAAGTVFVPIHDSRKPHQVSHVVNDCEIQTLITSQRKWQELRDVAIHWPSLRSVILVDDPPDDSQQPEPHQIDIPSQRDVTIDRWPVVDREGDTTSIEPAIIGSDLAAILYTSGSTGAPKGVMLSHANVMAGASIVSEYLEITRQDRILAVLPFSFDAGLNQLTTAAQQTATLVIQPFVLAKQIVRALQRHRITALAGVPTFWNLLCESKMFCTETYPDLRYITNTGGALPRKTLDQLRATLDNTRIYLMYGLTEAFRSTYLPPEQLDLRPDSIGKAIPNTELMVVDNDGQVCPPGQAGELVHRGPTVTLGYWGNTQQTRMYLRPDPKPRQGDRIPEFVCYSGDLVRQDDEGYFYFISRRDHQIKSAGFRVSPNEIEDVLLEQPTIRAAAVIGVPDELLGESIEAWVVPAVEAEIDVDDDRPFLDRIREKVAERLPSYMIPKSYRVVDRLPKTTSGKVDYGQLKRTSTETE